MRTYKNTYKLYTIFTIVNIFLLPPIKFLFYKRTFIGLITFSTLKLLLASYQKLGFHLSTTIFPSISLELDAL